MTAKRRTPKTPPTRDKVQPPEQGLVAVTLTLQALSLMPLHALAEGRNQSIPSLLHELTGLSKARISKGNLDAIRPSTQAKVSRHLAELHKERYRGDPEGLKLLQSQIASAPTIRSGKHALLASWVHQIEFLPWIPLPITKGFAMTVDELLEALLTCCRDDDLQGFKSVLLAHAENKEQVAHALSHVPRKPVTEPDLKTLQAIDNWNQADNWTRNLVDQLYWDLISTLDAEWNSHYFAGRQTKPLFPLVMVRPQEGLLENLQVSSRKNILFRPVRRLLEFLYAFAHYMRRKSWPTKAPMPETLAGILYRPGSQEVADRSLISNYFDGTTKVTLDLALIHWEQLIQHFMGTCPKSEIPNPPLPLIMLALQWQTLLVQDKENSFLMPDMKRYEATWNLRREQWATLQADQNLAFPRAGQTTREPIDWPAWSFSQSSSC